MAVSAPPVVDGVALRGVSHAYRVEGGARQVLARTDLRVRRGELLSVIGPSGCGKSTLLRICGGLLLPSTGEVEIDGAAPRDARRARSVGFVFQDPALLPWRRVDANVRLPLEVAGRAAEPRVEAALSLVGLAHVARSYPHQLSGGMKQRVALARALVLEPPLLLMDEPFGALDDITRSALRHELLRIRARSPRTVIFVTHSIHEAVLLSDRVAVMGGSPGRITEVVAIDLPYPRTPELEEQPAFHAEVSRVRAALRRGALS